MKFLFVSYKPVDNNTVHGVLGSCSEGLKHFHQSFERALLSNFQISPVNLSSHDELIPFSTGWQDAGSFQRSQLIEGERLDVRWKIVEVKGGHFRGLREREKEG